MSILMFLVTYGHMFTSWKLLLPLLLLLQHTHAVLTRLEIDCVAQWKDGETWELRVRSILCSLSLSLLSLVFFLVFLSISKCPYSLLFFPVPFFIYLIVFCKENRASFSACRHFCTYIQKKKIIPIEYRVRRIVSNSQERKYITWLRVSPFVGCYGVHYIAFTIFFLLLLLLLLFLQCLKGACCCRELWCGGILLLHIHTHLVTASRQCVQLLGAC